MVFYHSEKLQSTKTGTWDTMLRYVFYHSEKLQSTKTRPQPPLRADSFIIAKNYRVLKQNGIPSLI